MVAERQVPLNRADDRVLIAVLHLTQAIYYRMWFLLPTVVLAGIGEVLGWSGRVWSAYAPLNQNPYLMQYVFHFTSHVHNTHNLFRTQNRRHDLGTNSLRCCSLYYLLEDHAEAWHTVQSSVATMV